MSEPFEGTFTVDPSAYNFSFHGQGKVLLTITSEGKIIIGDGLSADEATQQVAKMLAEHYGREMERIRRES